VEEGERQSKGLPLLQPTSGVKQNCQRQKRPKPTRKKAHLQASTQAMCIVVGQQVKQNQQAKGTLKD
jgi:hypothetical protein